METCFLIKRLKESVKLNQNTYSCKDWDRKQIVTLSIFINTKAWDKERKIQKQAET